MHSTPYRLEPGSVGIYDTVLDKTKESQMWASFLTLQADKESNALIGSVVSGRLLVTKGDLFGVTFEELGRAFAHANF